MSASAPRRDGSRFLALALLLGAIVIALVAAAALLTSRTASSPPAPTPGAAAPGAPAPAPPSGVAAAPPALETSAPTPGVAEREPGGAAQRADRPAPAGPASRALEAMLASGADDLLDDEHRAAQFELALSELAEHWPSLEEGAIESVLDACLARAASPRPPNLTRALAPAVLRLDAAHSAPLGAHEVAPAAFGAGALWRFALDPSSPRALADQAHAFLAAAELPAPVGDPRAAFGAGAGAALLRLPGAIVGADPASGSAGDAGAWRRWLDCARALAAHDPATFDSLLAHGAERLLAAASVRNPDQTTRALLLEIIAAGDWSRDGSPLRAGALRWLEDASIASRELAPITQWLVSTPAARDAGADAAISPDAASDARARARDRLAAHWRLATPAALDAVLLRWRDEAKRALDDAPRSASAVERLARAATLARLCAVAALIHRADAAGARALLADLAGPARDAADSSSRAAINLIESIPPDDGAWALRFLSARRSAADRRLAMLEMTARTGTLGPVDAETLVEAAIFSSPSDVRLGAYRAVERRATDATIVNALLEQLPRAPRSESFSNLVARATGRRLPPVRDAAWPVDARRALVARLLTDLTGSTALAALDRLAAVLAGAHSSWAGLDRHLTPDAAAASDASPLAAPPPTPTRAASAANTDPALAVRAVAESLRRAARESPAWTSAALRDSSLGALDRRRAARASLAEGPVQSFEAGALAVADLLALLIQLERPARADGAQLLLDRLEALRAASNDVYETLDAIHETLARLWALRLGDAA